MNKKFRYLNSKHLRVRIFTIALFAGILIAGQATLTAHPALAGNTPQSFAKLVAKVKNSVVNISTTQIIKESPMLPFFMPNGPFGRFQGPVPERKMKVHALGSGFVIAKNGLILTNNHVVAKASSIKIKLADGHIYDAKVVGRDPKTDLALIKVKPGKDFPKPVKLGDSDAIQVGDWVVAVGNPFGLGHTVTAGIISAKGRVIGAGPYDDFLQTDAAINPGNSGGPLFNMKGEVVGINTAIIKGGQGIGFAIPINLAKKLLPQLEKGKVIRGWLGVQIQDITPELAKSFKLKKDQGVVISEVFPGTPAEKAGLKQGDVIIAFNGKKIKNAYDISRMVAATAPKTKATVQIIRNGEEKEIQVTIGTMPESGQLATASPATGNPWGMQVQKITPELAERLGLASSQKGVVITEVRADSPAANAGLRPGDVILEIDRKKIQGIKDYETALRNARSENGLLLLIKRGRGNLYVVLKKKAD